MRSALAMLLIGLGSACGGGPAQPNGGRGGAAAMAPAGAGGTAGGAPVCAVPDGGPAGAGGWGGDPLAACEACQRAHAADVGCPPELLSATYTIDPETGDHVALGWGLATLATEAQRAAGAALLGCLNAHDCATDSQNVCPGDNPTLGCFCGTGVTAIDCIGGAGVHGVCLPEYAAAAAATPGGPPAGASLVELSLFVTTAAYDPSGPIGIADMIKRCAIDAPCPVCARL
jgi:hypothetical protein